jgi:hypothetical protein
MNGIQNYWINLFPVLWKKIIEHMVTCGGKYKMDQLEFIPRWTNTGGQTVMARYIIFKTGDELIRYCQTTYPHTLQLGGVFPLMDETLYETDPAAGRLRDRELIKSGVCSAEGPLKIDLDIKDYDRSGVCECVGAVMCTECWDEFMHSARIIIDYVLRNIFRLTNIFHFWSGNRGLHVWCFDERAIRWTKAQRSTFIDTIQKRENLEHQIPEAFKRLQWPVFDREVTADPTHPLGIPFAPHHSTGAIRIPLPFLSDLKTVFDPKMHLQKSTTSTFCTQDSQQNIEHIREVWI